MLFSEKQTRKRVGHIILLLLLSCRLQAQIVTNQGQSIYVSDVTLAIGGGVDNRGVISNYGTIRVSGDWTNNKKYKAGNGTLVLDGNTDQHIRHNSDSFHILELKGTGDKMLNDEAQVIHEFKFATPVLLRTVTSSGALTLLRQGTITGAGADAYIDGLVYHEGTGKKTFPIGKDGNYLPVTLENIISDDSKPVTGIEIATPNSGARAGQSLSSVSQVRSFHLVRKRGNGINTLITLPVAYDEGNASEKDWVVAESNGQSAIYRSLGQANFFSLAGQRYLTSSALVTGSFFAIGISGESLGAGLIYVPSGFSPRALNPEDQVVKVYGDLLSPDDFEFKVFSKWGNEIFESRSLKTMQTTGWRGVDNSGDAVSIGSYTYLMKGKFFNGKSFEKSGSITLIR